MLKIGRSRQTAYGFVGERCVRCFGSSLLEKNEEGQSIDERSGAFSALCLLLVGEVASENLAIFAANVLGIFIVQLLKKCPR